MKESSCHSCYYYSRFLIQRLYRKISHYYYHCPHYCLQYWNQMFIPVSIDHIEERKSLVRDICKLISYLFIIFIFFLIVIIFYINYEHWNLTDTIYFVICTISTVGKTQNDSPF